MIKQSSWASTGPRGSTIKCKGSKAITKGYIIMGSININKHIIRVIKGPSPYAISIRGPSTSISKAPSKSSIIIQAASYCDHCKGHSTSSSDIWLPTSVVGIKDNLQFGVGINDNLQQQSWLHQYSEVQTLAISHFALNVGNWVFGLHK